MKLRLLIILFMLLSQLTVAQTDTKKLVDSLKYVDELLYICRGPVPNSLSHGCGHRIYWEVVKRKGEAIPFLIDKLSDPTETRAMVRFFGGQAAVGDIAYEALEQIINGIPTFQLLGVEFDTTCGFCSYWYHLRKSKQNRKKFQAAVRAWYEANKANLVWVESTRILVCDCSASHPNGGYYELKK